MLPKTATESGRRVGVCDLPLRNTTPRGRVGRGTATVAPPDMRQPSVKIPLPYQCFVSYARPESCRLILDISKLALEQHHFSRGRGCANLSGAHNSLQNPWIIDDYFRNRRKVHARYCLSYKPQWDQSFVNGNSESLRRLFRDATLVVCISIEALVLPQRPSDEGSTLPQ